MSLFTGFLDSWDILIIDNTGDDGSVKEELHGERVLDLPQGLEDGEEVGAGDHVSFLAWMKASMEYEESCHHWGKGVQLYQEFDWQCCTGDRCPLCWTCPSAWSGTERPERYLAWMTAFETSYGEESQVVKRGWVLERDMKFGSNYFRDPSFKMKAWERKCFSQKSRTADLTSLLKVCLVGWESRKVIRWGSRYLREIFLISRN
jgi:hypothetical protein